jgi:hypothetical protein
VWFLPWLVVFSGAGYHALVAYHHYSEVVAYDGHLAPSRVGTTLEGDTHVAMLAGHGRKGRTTRALNVLYIVADDLRPQLASYGRGAVTPHLASLAARGVIFDRAYAQVTVCNPSRVSFMTGRKPDVTQGKASPGCFGARAGVLVLPCPAIAWLRPS